MSWGKSESRSGYFGESWGDYLIDLSIAFRGFTCIIGKKKKFFFDSHCLSFSVVAWLYVAGALSLPRCLGRKGFVT